MVWKHQPYFMVLQNEQMRHENGQLSTCSALKMGHNGSVISYMQRENTDNKAPLHKYCKGERVYIVYDS